MFELTLPELGERVSVATITAWHKHVDDAVSVGEVLLSVAANKCEVDCPSPVDGVLRAILAEADSEIRPASVVALIGSAAEPLPELAPYRMALAGPGPLGQTTALDEARFASALAEGRRHHAPVSAMRRAIALRMRASLDEAPHYFITMEADMEACKQFRQRAADPRPSLNVLVLRAAILALGKYPRVNGRWLGDVIEEMDDVDLGFAVAVPDGLLVPVLRRAQDLSMPELDAACRDLVKRAQEGRLAPDDCAANTFTVSNLGALGVDSFCAIINPPASAILAVGQVKDAPAVQKGQLCVRPQCKLTLSSDHRVLDGAVAAQFLGYLKKILERAEF